MLYLLFFIIIFIFSITIHEFSHGYVADQLGDPTPRLSKRLTLNPIPHIDLFGTIILPFIFKLPIGWAKPMPIDLYNLKNPRKDMALIAIAGPAANLTLALILAILLRLFIFIDLKFISIIGLLLSTIINFNIMLAVFNLLPISPLDGFKFIGGILPKEKSVEWYQLEKYGLIFLLLLLIPINNSSMLNNILSPIISFISNIFIPQGLGTAGII